MEPTDPKQTPKTKEVAPPKDVKDPSSTAPPAQQPEWLDLKALFASQYQRPTKVTGTGTLPSSQTLRQYQQRLAALFGASPSPTLTADEQSALQGKRTPLLQEILAQMGISLQGRTDVAQALSAPPSLFNETAEADLATGRYIQGAQQVALGAANGSRLLSDRMRELCDEILSAALAKAEEYKGSTDPAERKIRAAILSHFGEAFRVRQQMAQRDLRAKQAEDKNAQPLKERIDQAQKAASDSQLLEQFVSDNRQP